MYFLVSTQKTEANFQILQSQLLTSQKYYQTFCLGKFGVHTISPRKIPPQLGLELGLGLGLELGLGAIFVRGNFPRTKKFAIG